MSICGFPCVVSRHTRPVDGKIGALLSPGHGHGWSTSTPSINVPTAVFDAEIIAAVLARDMNRAAQLATVKIPGFVADGASQLVVVWMNPGEEFRIGVLDGHEYIMPQEKVVGLMTKWIADEGKGRVLVA